MVHVNPGDSEPEDCDYWWSQEHDRRFFTFIDKYQDGCQPEFVKHLSSGHRVRLLVLLLHRTASLKHMPFPASHQLSLEKSCCC